MTETLLALVPTYGLWLIAAAVTLSCVGLPIPSSILVMAAGGFAAAGDLVYWQLVLATCTGFVVGDQLVYALARRGGPPLLGRLRCRPRAASVIERAERLIGRFGVVAVLLSRTVLSPLGPWVGFLSGALRLGWARYSAAATLGAICWSLAYATLGHAFADRIAVIAPPIGNSIGVVMAGSVVVALVAWLARGWKAAQARAAA